MEHPNLENLTNTLLADLEQFGQSLWRNEEIGEKRVNFFLTLMTAVVGGLVAFYTAENKLPGDKLKYVTNGALAGLLVLGALTYLRMLHRNRVTDQYKRTLDHIRGKLLELNQPFSGYEVPQPLGAGQWKTFRGGLAEIVGAMDAVLISTLLIFNSVDIVWAGAVGVLFLIVSWGLAARRWGLS